MSVFICTFWPFIQQHETPPMYLVWYQGPGMSVGIGLLLRSQELTECREDGMKQWIKSLCREGSRWSIEWLFLPVEMKGMRGKIFIDSWRKWPDKICFLPLINPGPGSFTGFLYYLILLFFPLIKMTPECTKHGYNLMNSIIFVKKKTLVQKKKKKQLRV